MIEHHQDIDDSLLQKRKNIMPHHYITILALLAVFILLASVVIIEHVEHNFAIGRHRRPHYTYNTKYKYVGRKEAFPSSLNSNIINISNINNIPLLDVCGSPITETTPHQNRQFCSKEHQRVVEQCSPPGSNMFLSGRNGILHNKTFTVQPLPSTNTNSSMKLKLGPIPQCQTVSEYLDSVKLGTREWEMNMVMSMSNGIEEEEYNRTDPNELERHFSRFIPTQCHVPNTPPSPEETCEIMNRFSHFYVDGDSLSRHMKQTMIMIMRGDWSTGGVMTTNNVTKAKCTCDGQYSEHATCRVFDPYFTQLVSPMDIPLSTSTEQTLQEQEQEQEDGRGYTGICSNLLMSSEEVDNDNANDNTTTTTTTTASTTTNTSDIDIEPHQDQELFQIGSSNKLRRSDVPFRSIDCTSPTYRGLFLMIQGGLHFRNNATITYDTKVAPVLNHPTYQQCVKEKKVHLVIIGATAQSRWLDDVYIHQSREHAILFNEEMKDLVKNSGVEGSEDVLFIDWWNMTKDSISDDGLHSMLDVNLSKASQVLYLMDMLSKTR